MEPAPSLCMAECCSLWGRNGNDSGFGVHALEAWCLQRASATWKQCEVIWSTRSWPGVEQPSSCSTAGLHTQLGRMGMEQGKGDLASVSPDLWEAFTDSLHSKCGCWSHGVAWRLSWQTKGHVLHLEIVVSTFYSAEKVGECFCWSFILIPSQRRFRQKLPASLKTLSSSGIFLAEIIITN